jgi:hypothetical protein
VSHAAIAIDGKPGWLLEMLGGSFVLIVAGLPVPDCARSRRESAQLDVDLTDAGDVRAVTIWLAARRI